MGLLMAPEVPDPGKSIAAALHKLPLGPAPPPSPPLSSLLPPPGSHPHPFTWAASADLRAATGPFGFKCPDAVLSGAAAGRWGAVEQGLECVPEGMATGSEMRLKDAG